jgi:ethanolamine-phosphate phospho-lyase
MTTKIQSYLSEEINSITQLGGYENLNYLIKTNTSKYILKTYLYNEDTYDLLTEENRILTHLQNFKDTETPHPIKFNNNETLLIININNEQRVCRLLSYIEGQFLGETKINSEELLSSLGKTIATLNNNLKNFNSYFYKSRKWEWNIENLYLNKKYLDDIDKVENKRVATYFIDQFDANVVPRTEELRKSIIHNDINEWNVLIKDNNVSGIIDFGDVTYSFIINELAIAIIYATYNNENYLTNALSIIKSYHEVKPLTNIEIDCLYYIIAARLVISVCNSAHARKTNPENDHAFISEEKAWKMLHYLVATNPIYFSNTIKETLGFKVKTLPNIEEVKEKRHQHLAKILSVSYKNPIYVEKAAFQYMYDAYGNTFLDAYNNIPHVGHSHPKVVKAGQEQMAKLNTNTRYLYDILNIYAEKLLSKFPPSLNKVFFVTSGSEANDLAIRMAKKHTGHSNVMVVEHGYHGHTQADIDISDYKFNNPKGQGQKKHVVKTIIPDTYRGRFTKNDGTAGKQYAEIAINDIKTSPNKIAAFIAEPIVGCGGQIPLAKGYLKPVYEAIRAQGGICISDEVQTGFGRLGDHFWGYEAENVIPDMVVIGKPIGNGHPMAAVICTDEIADSFNTGVEFFTSFGGNPVSCAIGLAVLEVIEEENLQENAKIIGNYYKEEFSQLQKKFPCIGDIRGSGLFLGFDIIKDDTTEPDTELAHHIKNELRERKILISTDGPADNVLKTKPPLIFTKKDVDIVIQNTKIILENHYNKR